MSKQTPPRGYDPADTERRKHWLKEKTGRDYPTFEPEDPANLRGLVENHIGFLGMPVTIAGPLTIRGSYAAGTYYVPLCVLEGALTLSMTRGCFLTDLCGGIRTTHLRQEMNRSPIFAFAEVEQALTFSKWIEQNFARIKEVAETTTRHGKLLRLDSYMVHNRVIVDFVFQTGEAAGQNMVTLATAEACRFIRDQLASVTPCRYMIESNFACDKNPGYKTILKGRGHSVIASVSIPERLLHRILRTSSEAIAVGALDVILASQTAGLMGFNSHAANALAALYLATGQDIACIVENAVGTMAWEVRDQGVFVSLSMPSITVGTVGGATRLQQQRAHLEMLECTGEGSSRKLAEIVCAATLALEISLAGAIASDEFASAHASFGRRPEPREG